MPRSAHLRTPQRAGDDKGSGLRFLFNATAPKDEPRQALQGIPEALYLDDGPIAKSAVFNTVMERLGVRVMTQVLADRPTAIVEFLSSQLDAGRTRELADRMRAVALVL